VTRAQAPGNGTLGDLPRIPAIPLTPEPATDPADQSIGALVKDAAAQVSVLLRSEIELARGELVVEVKKAVRGSVFFVLALAVLVFSLFFLFIAIGEVLAIWLPRSAAFGIVFGLMLLVAGLFGLLGLRRMKSIRAPARTIGTVRDTAAAMRNRGNGAEPADAEGVPGAEAAPAPRGRHESRD
jgi:uncharacterized membrane protein YqjE